VLVLEIVLFFTFFKSNIRLQIVQFLQIMKPSILYFLVYDRYSFFATEDLLLDTAKLSLVFVMFLASVFFLVDAANCACTNLLQSEER
jgi:hypothetical protein